MGANTKKKEIKVVIEMRGGMMQMIHTNANMEFVTIDWDNISSDVQTVGDPLGPDRVYGEIDLSNIIQEEDHHLIKNHPWNGKKE